MLDFLFWELNGFPRAGHSLIYSRFAIRSPLNFSHGSLTLMRSFSVFQVSLVAQSLIAQPVVRSAIKCQIAHKIAASIMSSSTLSPWTQKNTNIHTQPKSLRLFVSIARIYRPNFRINKAKTLIFNDWKRVFWACFHETWVYRFVHMSVPHLLFFQGINYIPPPHSRYRNHLRSPLPSSNGVHHLLQRLA